MMSGSNWVDEVLLDGPDTEVCLDIGGQLTRAALRGLVTERQDELAAAGLVPGSGLALCLPPSLELVVAMLAGWRAGAQVCLLDHRLTGFEVDAAVRRVRSAVLVRSATRPAAGLRGFHEVTPTIERLAGGPVPTRHALLQLSSGSTGPSKVIGRTATDLAEEIQRYAQIEAGVPRPGERLIVLSSMVHVLGLVGGLLYGLGAHCLVSVPARLTGEGILAAVAASPIPATVLGVPFHIDLLRSVEDPPRLPQLLGMTTGGEPVRPQVFDSFTERYGARLGSMYGMTEVGVIATDLFGSHRPALAPAPGMRLRESDGELLLAMPATPYVGLADPTRFVDGWLHTRDAGEIDPRTGLVTVRGRLDSQVSVGGTKVDLTEVEQTLTELPGVAAAVVVHDRAIEAYVALSDPSTRDGLEAELAGRLAAYKRPKMLHVLPDLPRTPTGKLLRDLAALRAAAETNLTGAQSGGRTTVPREGPTR